MEGRTIFWILRLITYIFLNIYYKWQVERRTKLILHTSWKDFCFFFFISWNSWSSAITYPWPLRIDNSTLSIFLLLPPQGAFGLQSIKSSKFYSRIQCFEGFIENRRRRFNDQFNDQTHKQYIIIKLIISMKELLNWFHRDILCIDAYYT